MKSVMIHNFSQTPKANIPRSSFDRSHGYKTTLTDGGVLYPIYLDEAIPGDTHSLSLTAFARLATPKVPFMDNLRMTFFFFSVPLRLIWDNFQRFMGEQDDPDSSTDFTVPKMVLDAGSNKVGELSDYFGIPIGNWGGAITGDVNTLPFRAYNLIWNQWFRDQNMQDSVTVDKDDGPDAIADYVLKRRGKRHDYFTSCLPWPQKGDAVSLPLGIDAPIAWHGNTEVHTGWGDGRPIVRIADDAYGAEGAAVTNYSGNLITDANGNIMNGGTPSQPVSIDPMGSLYADLSLATAATINSLREAFQLQKLLERDARGGTRYVEIVKSHFGVESPDLRATRPVYLGGGSIPVNINLVAQTSSTDAVTPQGNLAAFGTAAGGGIGFTASFTEHTILMGLVCITADLTYQTCMEKIWTKETRYDFPWPALCNLGEQAVLNQEIYFQNNPGTGPTEDQGVFGYQERYSELRYKLSRITGLMNSNAPSSLHVWHLAQVFGSLPTLGEDFIEEHPPMTRIMAVNTEPAFIYDSFIKLRSVRPIPTYGVPGLIDHF